MTETGRVKKRAPAKGPNLVPIREYMEAQKHYLAGDKEKALDILSTAVGSDKPLKKLEGYLDKVFDPGTALSDITAHLVLVETKRRN